MTQPPPPPGFDYGGKLPSGQFERHPTLPAGERQAHVRPVRESYRHVGTRPVGHLRDLTPDETATFNQDGAFAKFEVYSSDDQRAKVGGSAGLASGRFWTEAELKSGCGQVTRMSRDLAETYATRPTYYGRTFCSVCRDYFRVGPNEQQGEFVWVEPDGTNGPRVGT